MHHLKDEDDSVERAMEVVVAALKDPDTHIGEQRTRLAARAENMLT